MQRSSRQTTGGPNGIHPLKALPQLAGLIDRAQLLSRMELALRAVLPAGLITRFRVANVRDARLVLLANSPATAGRLRLLGPQILARAALVLGQPLVALTVEVGALPAETFGATTFKPLPPTAATDLRRTASLLADPELRGLLLRLASLA